MRQRLCSFCAFLCILVSSFLPRSVFGASTYEPPVIRIAVIKEADSITVSVRGSYKILSLYTREVLQEGRKLSGTRITPTTSGLMLDKKPLKIFGIRIETPKDASIIINRRRFRGSVDIIRTEALKILVVNYVDVENYVRGVLYHEVSPRWTMEALKAQAIAARTFAVYQSRVRKREDYDLTSDVYSQVYGGRTSERWRTNRAVALTRGQVASYKGKIFPTYYHATCGGHTEDAARYWKTDLAVLKGVACDYCGRSPHYQWHRNIALAEIERKLRDAGHAVSGVSALSVEGRYDSGKVINVVIKGNGDHVKISAYTLRLIIGPDVLRSTNFDVTVKDGIARFNGYGWGHGVGMCQWGSYLMSRQDRNVRAKDIIEFYYPGSEVKRLDELHY